MSNDFCTKCKAIELYRFGRQSNDEYCGNWYSSGAVRYGDTARGGVMVKCYVVQ